MKKSILTLCLIFVGTTASFSNNFSLEVITKDCYEEAFDMMEDAENKGLSEENIKAAGEFAYCVCEPSCEWE